MAKPKPIARLLQRAKAGEEESRGDAVDRPTDAEATAGADEPAVRDATGAPAGKRRPDAGGGGDFDLEAGIVAIFETIRSGGGDQPGEELPADSGATYALLARLNQLWESPGRGEAST